MSMPPQQRPPGWQQGPWPPQPPPPLPDFAPEKKNTVKWLLIAVAVLLVVGVTVGATLFFTRDNGGAGSTESSAPPPSDIASANDTGPVAIISDEPTCPAFIDINNSNAKIQREWETQRRELGPEAQWTPDQRSQVETVVTAIHNSADKAVALAKQTPHRVMRELYGQYVAYGRAYADAIPNYVPDNNYLATAHVDFGNTLAGICTAVTTKSANRSLAVEAAPEPSSHAPVDDLKEPQKLFSSSNANCAAWISNENEFLAASTDWQNLDTSVEGSRWTPEQRAIQLAAYPVLRTFGVGMASIGRQSEDPIWDDFGQLGKSYLRAYVSAGDGYIGSDSWLSYTGMRMSNAVTAACHAADG